MNIKTIIKKFETAALKPTDFEFEWAISRIKRIDFDAIAADVKAAGLLKTKLTKKEAAKEFAIKTASLKKHTAKNWTYCLFRRIKGDAELAAYIYKLGEKIGSKNLIALPSWISLLRASAEEHLKDRKFASYSAMQKWINKKRLGIDVSALREVEEAEREHVKKTLKMI